jgi:hypothetical protein
MLFSGHRLSKEVDIWVELPEDTDDLSAGEVHLLIQGYVRGLTKAPRAAMSADDDLGPDEFEASRERLRAAG